ncbi:MAG: hypothetical protein JNG88_18775, partial [Phycisphaerales bacterium]|nr:hypothetical protein [Phycisphaerales bacterium]
SRNAIDAIMDWNAAASPPPTQPTTTAFLHDPSGNLVYDGAYAYFYDGLNRLIQINLPGTVVFDSLGRVVGGTPGALVSQFTYDGLGRLAQRVRPAASGSLSLRVEDFYYDGVRRIHETVNRGESLEYSETEPDPAEYEEPFEIIPLDPAPGWVVLLDNKFAQQREYFWGTAYVDEIVAQMDWLENTYYYLQDANYNVTAVLPATISFGQPTVLMQYTWSPYGELLYADNLGGVTDVNKYAGNRVGFQGLFFERLDGAVTAQPLATCTSGTIGAPPGQSPNNCDTPRG